MMFDSHELEAGAPEVGQFQPATAVSSGSTSPRSISADSIKSSHSVAGAPLTAELLEDWLNPFSHSELVELVIRIGLTVPEASNSIVEMVQSQQKRKIFVCRLSPETSSASLHQAFSLFGEVTEAVVVQDTRTKRSRGFGFVMFADAVSADRALQMPFKFIDGWETESAPAMISQEEKARRLAAKQAQQKQAHLAQTAAASSQPVSHGPGHYVAPEASMSDPYASTSSSSFLTREQLAEFTQHQQQQHHQYQFVAPRSHASRSSVHAPSSNRSSFHSHSAQGDNHQPHHSHHHHHSTATHSHMNSRMAPTSHSQTHVNNGPRSSYTASSMPSQPLQTAHLSQPRYAQPGMNASAPTHSSYSVPQSYQQPVHSSQLHHHYQQQQQQAQQQPEYHSQPFYQPPASLNTQQHPSYQQPQQQSPLAVDLSALYAALSQLSQPQASQQSHLQNQQYQQPLQLQPTLQAHSEAKVPVGDSLLPNIDYSAMFASLSSQFLAPAQA